MLLPGMVFLSVVVLLMASFDDGFILILLIALLGTFFYSDQPILTAAALDEVGEGVATTTLGVISFAKFLLSAIAPIIAGFLYDNYSMQYVFYFVSLLMLSGALILAFVKLKKPARSATHHH